MQDANKIIDWIKSSKKIVITSHRSPDGDSIGSSLGLYRFIKALGCQAEICHPDPCPTFLNWAKNGVEVFDFESNKESVTKKMNEADLIFCLDYNGANRLGNEMGEVLTNASSKKVMIDHHLHPDDFVDIAVSEPSVCSTSQLILDLIEASGNLDLLSPEIGTPLYLGVMTDTGSFRFGSVTPKTHIWMARLIEAGVNHSQIHENTFDTNTVDRLKLKGFAIAEKLEIIPELNVAIVSLTADELERFNYQKGDTEGLVNTALSIEGIQVAVFLSEKDGKIKMSFRSKGILPVNEVASNHFDGGGHRNAAGGISNLSMEDTLIKLRSVLPEILN